MFCQNLRKKSLQNFVKVKILKIHTCKPATRFYLIFCCFFWFLCVPIYLLFSFLFWANPPLLTCWRSDFIGRQDSFARITLFFNIYVDFKTSRALPDIKQWQNFLFFIFIFIFIFYPSYLGSIMGKNFEIKWGILKNWRRPSPFYTFFFWDFTRRGLFKGKQ